jgi:SAM-dependent methyltransferase
MKAFREYLYRRYVATVQQSEHVQVLEYLAKLPPHTKARYLEVGSGNGAFLPELRPFGFDITCLELNPELAARTRVAGFLTICRSILDNGFPDSSFDVVHCSHVIEHFGYPDIACVLDELARVTRNGGTIIIRSPLLHPRFYDDLDHIRPYPPETVLNYFSHAEQQRVGRFKVNCELVWIRNAAFCLCPYTGGRLTQLFNKLMMITYLLCRCPRMATGYVMVLRKVSGPEVVLP